VIAAFTSLSFDGTDRAGIPPRSRRVYPRGLRGAVPRHSAARRRAGTARARPEGGSLSPAIRKSEIQKPQPSRQPRRQHQNLPR